MSNIAVFQAEVPSWLAAFSPEPDEGLSAGVTPSFSVLSIRGRAWRIVQGSEERVITLPGSDDPAPSIEVVLLRGNPAVSKTYYKEGYVEGADGAPDCFSHDGITPDPASPHPQSDKCATCPMNVWGSKVTPSGTKVKACADNRRLAVAPSGALDSPMLLRIPAASLGELAEFGRMLDKKGVPYHAVVTRMGFDTSVAYPKVTFKPQRFLDEAQFKQASATRDSDLVSDIIGTSHRAAPVKTEAAAPAAEAKPEAKPAAKRTTKPKPEPVAEVAEPVAVEVQSEATAQQAPAVTAPKEGAAGLNQQLEGLLAGFDL